jgi:hypothetical protein
VNINLHSIDKLNQFQNKEISLMHRKSIMVFKKIKCWCLYETSKMEMKYTTKKLISIIKLTTNVNVNVKKYGL